MPPEQIGEQILAAAQGIVKQFQFQQQFALEQQKFAQQQQMFEAQMKSQEQLMRIREQELNTSKNLFSLNKELLTQRIELTKAQTGRAQRAPVSGSSSLTRLTVGETDVAGEVQDMQYRNFTRDLKPTDPEITKLHETLFPGADTPIVDPKTNKPIPQFKMKPTEVLDLVRRGPNGIRETLDIQTAVVKSLNNSPTKNSPAGQIALMKAQKRLEALFGIQTWALNQRDRFFHSAYQEALSVTRLTNQQLGGTGNVDLRTAQEFQTRVGVLSELGVDYSEITRTSDPELQRATVKGFSHEQQQALWKAILAEWQTASKDRKAELQRLGQMMKK